MITHVQTLDSAMASDTGTTQVRSVTWTQGRCGILYCEGWISAGSPSITSVIGSVSGTWNLAIASVLASNRTGSFYYMPNITGGADTVTVTWSGSLGGGRIMCMEKGGVALVSPLGDAQTNNAAANTTHTLTLTAPVPNSLYVYGIHMLGDNTISGDLTQRSEAETFPSCHVMDTISSGAVIGTWTFGASISAHKIGFTLKPQPSGFLGNFM